MASGASKKYEITEELEEIIGSGKTTAGDALKGIWAYAEEEDLKTQKKHKGKNMGAIKSDSILSPVIGTGIVAAPMIMKKMHEHLIKD